MALKQGRTRETDKKKSSASNPRNHWLMPPPGRSGRRSSASRKAPKSLPRRIAM
jgi:hypothetical protein